MPGGIYSALSGLQTRSARLDRLAADIANSGTSGYKAERGTNIAVERASFSTMLDSAVDVVAAPTHVDFSAGASAPTGRDLDMAIEGNGFFAIQTDGGVRYTRNGHFTRNASGDLIAQDGSAVLGENGPITLPAGRVAVGTDGTITVDGTAAGRAQVVTFSDTTRLVREDGVRFRAPSDMTSLPATEYAVQSGSLEQSNVSLPDRMAQLAELSRSFEALQRGLSVLMNEIDLKTITELGRR
jgi:flagellar basal-body rod protein FlgF